MKEKEETKTVYIKLFFKTFCIPGGWMGESNLGESLKS